MTTLNAGQNAPIGNPSQVTVRVSTSGAHLDVIALLLDANDRADDDNGVVLFSNPSAAGGSVRLDQATDTVTVDAAALPDQIQRVLIVAQADGSPTVHSAGAVSAVVAADGQPAATIQLDGLPAVATLQVGEVYRHNGAWKVRALGDGYAEGLAKLLTVHGVSVDDEPAPAAAAAPAPVSKVDLEKKRIVDLRKKVEAKAPISMVKSFEKASVSFEKQGLLGERAEVILVLDVSLSSKPLFKNGAYQALVDRALAAGLLFDDNGTIDTYLFDSSVREGEPVTLDNRDGWTDRAIKTRGIWGGTRYANPLREIAKGLRRGSAMPTFVYFVTDGGNQDKPQTKQVMKEISSLPAFVKFIAVGDESQFPQLQALDDMDGREVDNADFFAVADPRNVDETWFYEMVMQEFRGWLQETRRRGILGS